MQINYIVYCPTFLVVLFYGQAVGVLNIVKEKVFDVRYTGQKQNDINVFSPQLKNILLLGD